MPARQVQCKQCLAIANVPDGVDPHTMNWCTCCTADHHHGLAAEACPGNNAIGHVGAPCSHQNPMLCSVIGTLEQRKGEPCPGGHCGVGVEGCTVCRPVIHYVTAGLIMAGF